MGYAAYENSVLLDDHTVSFTQIPQDTDIDRGNAVKRIQKSWEGVKSDADGLQGLSLKKPDFNDLVSHLISSKSHAVMYEIALSKSELKLNVEAGNATINCGKVSIPGDREKYRDFLGSLNGWSNGDHDLVPDAAFKKWQEENPKKPPKYKDFEEMGKKSKADATSYRDWAKKDSKAKKAFADYDATAKLKPADAKRAAATKAVNDSMADWYKSYD